MVFALLIAAIIWNLGTWSIGLPASSSHTMIGSIMGVGLANQFVHTATNVSGVDWAQATKIFTALFWSPVLGFGFAALVLLAMKTLIRVPALYEEPKGDAPPPPWIRALLVLTCTGVSFSHGSNDGQKGMGLIMLILIGTVPTAYALNRALPIPETTAFYSNAQATQAALDRFDQNATAPADPRAAIKAYVQTKKLAPDTVPALAAMAGHLGDDVKHYGDLAKVPASAVTNTRNDMYLTSEAIRLMGKAKAPKFDEATDKAVKDFGKSLDKSTKYIPLWVKIVVAIALGLGTMVGWKRIVRTVGEKIGKTHLTYAQGASAELVTALLIGGADTFGLPVSTTHVLSSGVAGAMTANGSGVQLKTLRNIAMAWVLTLPVAMLLSGSLYVLFNKLFG
jgi:PiT family inorganic phosphate transporter